MATKKICDRCGAEINPISSITYAGIGQRSYDFDKQYELCCSCSMHLGRWLDGKEKMVGEEQNDG